MNNSPHTNSDQVSVKSEVCVDDNDDENLADPQNDQSYPSANNSNI